ncbi:MAG TPA: cytochrome b N-terminal domain-containing protein, partial [Vicinamibacterales bacterium]|nr:cytochrome b N-terminal domain-containing protein [Vicinamibacterales bacterium]
MLHKFIDWFDSRTGIRAARAHLLDEPIPAGTGWSFVTGSVVLFLILVQLATGVVLTMYYVPAPDHAYDSIRFIMDQLPFGSVLRGLHFFGASFIVVAAIVHMLRVVLLGSYKKPREVTWLTGIVLLLLILGFALSGYLLPWDQKAYWATTVTINVARSGPMGEYVAGLLRGGSGLGPLTLLRWYSAHVFLLPACLIGFVVAHVYLMRRHGISGPVNPVAGATRPFYPYHALKDTLAIALVFAALIAFAVTFRAPLDAVADPTDATYVPRPEWYFLSLFQLLKYFPGPLEPFATQGVPGLVVLVLVLLPFLGRGTSRKLRDRPFVAAAFLLIGLGVT